MLKKELILEGLDCANCAAKIEREANDLNGVKANMNFMNKTLTLETESETDYVSALKQVNLFAADSLIPDSEVEDLAKDECMDYFSMCRTLCVSPELMSFKLYSLIHRGYNYKLPQNINSGFLKS